MPNSDTFQAFACVMSTSIPLAHAGCMANPKLSCGEVYPTEVEGEGVFAE